MKKYQVSSIKYQVTGGFTLVEMLVVIAVLSIVGTLILNIFSRTLQGNNKAQIIGIIKQNGQTILETMDKTIRNADHLICIGTSTDPIIGNATLVVVKGGVYTRFRFIQPQPPPPDNPTVNGFIEWEYFNLPASPPPGTDPNLYVRDFDKTACSLPSTSPVKLTDFNTQTGVSVEKLTFTEQAPQAGYKNIVNVSFTLKAGVEAPAAVAGQIDPVDFQTTIQLR